MFFSHLYHTATLFTWIIAGIMVFSLVVQLIYYLVIYSRFARHRDQGFPERKIPVSVIICARNEAENLERNLPSFLTQDYPDYEVVVVNDCSTDTTEDVLMAMKVRYPHLYYTTIHPDRKFTHGKKLAVTVGIKAAKYDHLLFSDADCHPVSDQWIAKISRHFSEKTELILGVGKYERRRGLLNLIVRYETLFTAIQYISFAIRGRAYMGVGRNMAYIRELFFRHKGFAGHLKLLSGDDDLFVNEAATKTNTCVELSPHSLTISSPPETFREWFRQKKRHLSTGPYYKISSKLRLGAEYLTRLLFYLSVIILFFTDYWIWIAGAVWGLHAIVRMVLVKLSMRRLDERDLLLPSLLLDPLLPILLAALRVSNIIRPREPKWN